MSNTNTKEVYEWMSYFMLVLALVTFILLQFLPAPYGRYSSSSFGFLINARLAWFVQEIPSLAVVVVLYLRSDSVTSHSTNYLLILLFVIHYIHRSLIYPLVAVKRAHSNPFTTVFAAFLFCSYNGYLQGTYLLNHAVYPRNWFLNISSIIGVLLFFAGMFINICSDYTLRNLRKSDDKVKTGYKIPRGGLFEYVSCANFFGELLEWTGFALASWSLPALAFVVYTFSNLAPRAIDHHRWYKEKFQEEYPLSRKALIPFLI